MGIRQKFFVLAGVVGVIMAVVSCIGYYVAYQNLTESVEKEILASVEVEGQSLNGWLQTKVKVAESTANLMTALDAKRDIAAMREVTSLAASDKEIMSLATSNEDGAFMTWTDGDLSKKLDPRTRPWYQQAKQTGNLSFTDAYKDAVTGKMVVSVAVPYKDGSGAFRGVIAEDISLEALDQRAASIKYRGEGRGIVIEKTGKILAMDDANKIATVDENPIFKKHFPTMLQKGNGFFVDKGYDGSSRVLAYTTVPSTGWVVCVSVPESFVFAQVNKLKIMYGILTLLGLLIIVFACLQFSNRITRSIIRLKGHADELAAGNLQVDDLEVESEDELGRLTEAFNTMSGNIRDLIRKMASTSEQVAASSEELTASAQQSAEASNHVAGTVSQVADGMSDQMKNIDAAKNDVDAVCTDIEQVADKTKRITVTSAQTADAAKKGESLMNGAMEKMGHIETSVMDSAEVVRKLGENSQQIGQIVNTIAAIADQTNLLALNAAIEAARAGEHGKGFAVVAEEVRKLAAESQASTEQIKDRIASIQSDTERAVASMQGGTEEVKKGTTAIRDVGTQFSDIMRMVNEIKDQIDDINTAVQAVSGGANRIVSAVGSIDSVSRETAEHTQTISAATEEQSASTQEIASASQALAQMATELQEAAGRFRV